MTKWIGVDLDGTLSKQTLGSGVQLGAVVPKMRDRVKKWLAEGKNVRILTARHLSESQLKEINSFLDKNQIGGLIIQNHKDNDMAELWDDKAIRVEKDTGEVCKGCEPESSFSRIQARGFVLTDC